MGFESAVELAQLSPALSRLPGAPVPARQPAADRESRGGAGLVRLAALALFTAGLASAVAFSTRPPTRAAAAPRPAPVFTARTPAAAPALQSLAPAGGEVRSSPVPFYGGADRIAAMGADDAPASMSSQQETGRLVPFFQPAQAWRETEQPAQAQQAQTIGAQAQPRAQLAKAFPAPHLRPMRNSFSYAFLKGGSAAALLSSGIQTSMFAGARPCRNARPTLAFATPGDGGGPQPARRGFAIPGDGGVARPASQAFVAPGDGGGARQACDSCP